ncbi:hypothetical protein B0T20DRAFT_482701 [Sordaria brevicollis]|uniref:Uncharacterized protein n=1 Tax=Sordaria brevicollis TaxID=83679 RepID=A0AAE0P3D7_SORBR|nr:hypothetical protein B0T20DRAFT_482701 [Sordaria brevicollis]
MASHVRLTHPQPGVRYALFCFLGFISTIGAQNSLPPSVVNGGSGGVPNSIPVTTNSITGEIKGTYIDSNGSPSICPILGGMCFVTTVFDTFPSPKTSWFHATCATSGDMIPTLYLEVDTNALSSTQISTDVATIISEGETRTRTTQIITSDTIIPSIMPSDNDPSTTENPVPTSSTSSLGDPVPETQNKAATSKAWIAGVVAGPLLFLAAIGGLLFWWLRRHKQRKALAESGGLGDGGIHAQEPPCIQPCFAHQSPEVAKTIETPPMCELEDTGVHEAPCQGTGGATRL